MSTLIELLGGLAILAGAFVAAVSIPLIVMMLAAMFTVHLRYGFSAINTIGLTADGPQFGPPGYEVNLLYIAGLLALIWEAQALFRSTDCSHEPWMEHDMVHYRSTDADGHRVFYREAGEPAKPTVLLLHGFPTASHMFRDLIPLLADRYHVVAPDLPGFGNTVSPPRGQFDYTFDNLARVIGRFVEKRLA